MAEKKEESSLLSSSSKKDRAISRTAAGKTSCLDTSRNNAKQPQQPQPQPQPQQQQQQDEEQDQFSSGNSTHKSDGGSSSNGSFLPPGGGGGGGGGALLMDLFAPPPPASTTQQEKTNEMMMMQLEHANNQSNTMTSGSNNNNGSGASSSSIGSSTVPPGASSLMNLFAPPPNKETLASESSTLSPKSKKAQTGTTTTTTSTWNTSADTKSGESPEKRTNSQHSSPTRKKAANSSSSSNAQSMASAAANRALQGLFLQSSKGPKLSANDSTTPSPPKTTASPPRRKSQLDDKFRADSSNSVVSTTTAESTSPTERPPRPSSAAVLPYPERVLRQSTAPRSNRTSLKEQPTSLLKQQQWLVAGQSPASLPTPKAGSKQKVYNATSEKLLMADESLEPPLSLSSINETCTETSKLLPNNHNAAATLAETKSAVKSFFQQHFGATTFLGSFMFLLYHVVFCLAMGSSITRSSSQNSILGVMAKVTCVGIIFASPVFVYRMGNQIPALYATNDLFLAPFLAHLASIVDTTLSSDNTKYDDQVFFATFLTLSGIGMCTSATLLVLASKFKLANLGTYLPYPVLCGFFSAVGIMLWALSFAVDTNGHQWQAVLWSGNAALVFKSLQHHVPSLVVGVTMKWLGPKNPFYVSLLVIVTIMVFYGTMWATGTSLQEAQHEKWFWSRDDLVYSSRETKIGFDNWSPPAPFGVIHSLFGGKVHWGAVWHGMPTVCALSFLYLLRCSIHATALKKNISNLVRIVPNPTTKESSPTKPQLLRNISNGLKNAMKSPIVKRRQGSMTLSPTNSFRFNKRNHYRLVSEAVDIEAIVEDSPTAAAQSEKEEFVEIRAKNTKLSLKEIFMDYAYSQYLVAFVGGFAVCPSAAIAPTMYAIGAEGVAPQYGSVILLLIFYLTDFQLVCYIPKAAFSCLLVLAACDMIITWSVKSFKKTNELVEWLVVPLIVVFAFVVGLLNAVFLGVAISTFIFVASFFRTGVVKYVATGLTIRSTIERSIKTGNWLDQNGDLIQIIVIQSYLFFGNASSILNYISTMFEEPDPAEQELLNFDLPPMPKVIILDMTLISGMDTSTVDVFAEIKTLTASHDCKLFLAGLRPRLRAILASGGIKPETGERSKRHVRMFPDLDSALGKAEDFLIRDIEQEENVQRPRLLSEGDNGFRFALRQIDEQHGKDFALGLVPLYKYTVPVEIAPGEPLFSCEGAPLQDRQRGLFFIEYGMLKIERDSTQTLSRGNTNSLKRRVSRNDLNRMNARTGSIGRQAALLKTGPHEMTSQNFRLARIGPGWVVGAIEGVTGWKNPGCHVAVSYCRLHHLPYAKIEEIEKENPVLILRLYKMLAHLMARRQEVTIEQLATLHSIMTSPALTKPMSRATQGALANIQKT